MNLEHLQDLAAGYLAGEDGADAQHRRALGELVSAEGALQALEERRAALVVERDRLAIELRREAASAIRLAAAGDLAGLRDRLSGKAGRPAEVLKATIAVVEQAIAELDTKAVEARAAIEKARRGTLAGAMAALDGETHGLDVQAGELLDGLLAIAARQEEIARARRQLNRAGVATRCPIAWSLNRAQLGGMAEQVRRGLNYWECGDFQGPVHKAAEEARQAALRATWTEQQRRAAEAEAARAAEREELAKLPPDRRDQRLMMRAEAERAREFAERERRDREAQRNERRNREIDSQIMDRSERWEQETAGARAHARAEDLRRLREADAREARRAAASALGDLLKGEEPPPSGGEAA